MPLASIDPNVIAAIITAMLAATAALATGAWRKTRPEVEAIGTKSLIEVNSELRTEIDRLGEVVDRQREQIDRQERRIRELDEALSRADNRIHAMAQELDDLESRRDELGA